MQKLEHNTRLRLSEPNYFMTVIKGINGIYGKINQSKIREDVVVVVLEPRNSLNEVNFIGELTDYYKARQNKTHGLIITSSVDSFRVAYKNEVKLCKT